MGTKVKVKVKLQFIVHTKKAAVANVTDSMEYSIQGNTP